MLKLLDWFINNPPPRERPTLDPSAPLDPTKPIAVLLMDHEELCGYIRALNSHVIRLEEKVAELERKLLQKNSG